MFLAKMCRFRKMFLAKMCHFRKMFSLCLYQTLKVNQKWVVAPVFWIKK